MYKDGTIQWLALLTVNILFTFLSISPLIGMGPHPNSFLDGLREGWVAVISLLFNWYPSGHLNLHTLGYLIGIYPTHYKKQN